jgi:hypothetical protein
MLQQQRTRLCIPAALGRQGLLRAVARLLALAAPACETSHASIKQLSREPIAEDQRGKRGTLVSSACHAGPEGLGRQAPDKV